MYIDERELENGITAVIAEKLIKKYITSGIPERCARLRDYYIGRHSILNRVKTSKMAANNKVVCNYAKYIADIEQAYLTGNPITYTSSKDYDIEAIKEAYDEENISSIDSEISKDMNIFGNSFELVYADENAKPKSVRLKPGSAFVCYSQGADEQPLIGIYFYKTYDMDGSCTGAVCNVYDSNFIYKFVSRQNDYSSFELTETEQHYFGGVPLIEHINDRDRQGDIEQVTSLIDSYNLLMSDRINDKEQFVDAFLFLKNIDVDSDDAQRLKEERILMGYEDSKAEYLSKVMHEADIKVLRDDIRADILFLSMTPDLSDQDFGGNISGVSIKYKLLSFEQKIKAKVSFFQKSLRKRFELYNYYLNIKNQMLIVPTHKIDIVFTYNLPANELEIAQMISYLTGLVSNETLLERLPFITDAKEENELVKEEEAERKRMELEKIEELSARGY